MKQSDQQQQKYCDSKSTVIIFLTYIKITSREEMGPLLSEAMQKGVANVDVQR